jgi:hypothetical protein
MKISNKLLLWCALVCTLLLLLGSVFISLNGTYPHLGRPVSLALTLFLFGIGGGCAVAIFVLDRSRRVVAMVLIAVLFVLALPLFL